MKFAGAAMVLCLFGAPASASAQPSAQNLTLQQVLGKMRVVDGAVDTAHILSISSSVIDGDQVTIRSEAQGLRSFTRQCTGVVCIGSYFDGTRSYSVDINGTMEPQNDTTTDAARRALRIVTSLSFLDQRFMASGGHIIDGGAHFEDGRRFRRLYVVDSIAPTATVDVDPMTWLISREQIVGSGTALQLRDYRRVGAFLIPFELWRNGVLTEKFSSRELLGDQLAPPRGLMPVLSASSFAAPLDPNDPSPVTQCTLAGTSMPCLIDTGNSGMAMSLELAEKLDLQPIGAFRVRGIGNYATEVVRAGPLQLGNAVFPEADYVVLSDIHRVGYDLILGTDVLANMPVTIDYGRHRLFFGGDPQTDSRATIAPLQFENFVPVVDVLLTGEPARLAVDTGDESNINLSNPYFAAHPFLFQPTEKRNVSGVGGSGIQEVGRISKVQIGDLTMTNQVIGWTHTLNATGDGHLGTRFLANFTVILDYPRRRLELLPRE